MASGRGQVGEGGTCPPPSAAVRRARSRVPGDRGARGRRPALPSRSRTSRAAARDALPAPARSRASSIARRPPPPRNRGARAANRSARLPGASKTTIRKWLQLNCLSAPPPRVPPRRGGRGDGRRLPERAAGPRHNSAREGRPPRPASLRRPRLLPWERAARLAPRAAAAAAEVPLSPAPGGESTSTGASPQRAAADGSTRPARPLLDAA